MNKTADEQPAFPVGNQYGCQWEGMTKLEYFAAHAPPCPDWFIGRRNIEEQAKAQQNDRYIMRGIGDFCFEWPWYYANAMLDERAKRQGSD